LCLPRRRPNTVRGRQTSLKGAYKSFRWSGSAGFHGIGLHSQQRCGLEGQPGSHAGRVCPALPLCHHCPPQRIVQAVILWVPIGGHYHPALLGGCGTAPFCSVSACPSPCAAQRPCSRPSLQSWYSGCIFWRPWCRASGWRRQGWGDGGVGWVVDGKPLVGGLCPTPLRACIAALITHVSFAGNPSNVTSGPCGTAGVQQHYRAGEPSLLEPLGEPHSQMQFIWNPNARLSTPLPQMEGTIGMQKQQ
jgi:hypothetical protein